MKQSCPLENASKEHFKSNESMLLTELEWKFGLLNRFSSLNLLVPNINPRPMGAKRAIMGCKGRKNAVKYEVFMIYAN